MTPRRRGGRSVASQSVLLRPLPAQGMAVAPRVSAADDVRGLYPPSPTDRQRVSCGGTPMSEDMRGDDGDGGGGMLLALLVLVLILAGAGGVVFLFLRPGQAARDAGMRAVEAERVAREAAPPPGKAP